MSNPNVMLIISAPHMLSIQHAGHLSCGVLKQVQDDFAFILPFLFLLLFLIHHLDVVFGIVKALFVFGQDGGGGDYGNAGNCQH